jgi:hypothetical protein
MGVFYTTAARRHIARSGNFVSEPGGGPLESINDLTACPANGLAAIAAKSEKGVAFAAIRLHDAVLSPQAGRQI